VPDSNMAANYMQVQNKDSDDNDYDGNSLQIFIYLRASGRNHEMYHTEKNVN
jgi:hypothetical protein